MIPPDPQTAPDPDELLRRARTILAESNGKPTGNEYREAVELARESIKAEEAERSSWAAIDLGPVLAGEQVDEPPTLLTKADDHALFYAGKIHDLHGEPETCKGWIILQATAEEIERGNHVCYLDFEDDQATIVARLRALGVADEKIQAQFRYVRPNEPLDERAFDDLAAVLDPVPSLVVIDGITEALNLEGLSISDNNEVATWQAKVPRRIRDRTGAAVVGIDHVVKDPDARRRWALGAGHKLAGVDVAYSVKVLETFGRGLNGKVQIKVTKDRPGHVRRHAKDNVASEVHLTSDEDGRVTVKLLPPDPEGWRPSKRMEQVSRCVGANPGITLNAIRELVGGRGVTTDEATRLLLADNYFRTETKGQARLHFSVRPYRETEHETPNRVPVSEPCPDDPDTVAADHREPCPESPLIGTRGHGTGKRSKKDPENAPGPNRVPPRAEGSESSASAEVWDYTEPAEEPGR